MLYPGALTGRGRAGRISRAGAQPAYFCPAVEAGARAGAIAPPDGCPERAWLLKASTHFCAVARASGVSAGGGGGLNTRQATTPSTATTTTRTATITPGLISFFMALILLQPR